MRVAVLRLFFLLLSSIGLAIAAQAGPLEEAQRLVKEGKAQQSIPFFDQALAVEPNSIDLLLARAEAWRRAGKREHAIDDFTAALKLQPKHPGALAGRARLRFNLGQQAEARSDAEAALAADPGNALAHLVMAWVFNGGGASEPAQVIKQVDRAIELDPTLAEAFYMRSNVLERSGEIDRAIADVSRAIELDPTIYYYFHHRAELLEPRKDWAGMERDAAAAIRLKPDYFYSHIRRGFALAQLERHAEAVKEFDECLRMQPGHPRSLILRGWSLRNLDKLPEALRDFDRAIRAGDKSADAFEGRARTYLKMGERAKALDDLDRVLKAKPERMEIKSLRAFNRAEEGRWPLVTGEARAVLRSYGWQHTQAPYLALIIHLAERRNGHEDRAVAILKQAVAQLDAKKWPAPVFQFLLGKLPAADLLAAAQSPGEQTEARCYLGLQLLAAGDREGAREHLRWAAEKGVPTFTEVALAKTALRELAAKP